MDYIQKIELDLSNIGGAQQFVNESSSNSHIRQSRTMETSKVTPPFLLHFYHLLDMLQQCMKFHGRSKTSSMPRDGFSLLPSLRDDTVLVCTVFGFVCIIIIHMIYNFILFHILYSYILSFY